MDGIAQHTNVVNAAEAGHTALYIQSANIPQPYVAILYLPLPIISNNPTEKHAMLHWMLYYGDIVP